MKGPSDRSVWLSRLILLLGFAASTVTLVAQAPSDESDSAPVDNVAEEAAAEEPEAEPVPPEPPLPAGHVRIRFSVASPRPLRNAYYFNNGKPEELRFRSTGRSPRYDYTGPASLPIFQGRFPAANPDEAGEPIAFATLDSRTDAFFLLFLASGDDSEGAADFTVRVFDDSATHFPPRSIAILNLSGSPLEGQLREESPISLAVDEELILPADRVISLWLRVAENLPVYSQPIEFGERERVLVVLYPPSLPGSVSLQGAVFRETVPLPPPPPEPEESDDLEDDPASEAPPSPTSADSAG